MSLRGSVAEVAAMVRKAARLHAPHGYPARHLLEAAIRLVPLQHPAHLPGQVGPMIFRMVGYELPDFDGLKQRKHHSGQFRTPDTAGAVVIFPAGNGIAYRLFRAVVVHGHFRVSHKNDEPLPVVAQAGQNLTLRQVQLLRLPLWGRDSFGGDWGWS
jgi:hypothetical protein